MNLDALYDKLIERGSPSPGLVRAASLHAVSPADFVVERAHLRVQLARISTDVDMLTEWAHSDEDALQMTALTNPHVPDAVVLDLLDDGMAPWGQAAIARSTASRAVIAAFASQTIDDHQLRCVLLSSPLLSSARTVELLVELEHATESESMSGIVYTSIRDALVQHPRLPGLFAQVVSTAYGVDGLISTGLVPDFAWDTLGRRVEDLIRQGDASPAHALVLNDRTPNAIAVRVSRCLLANGVVLDAAQQAYLDARFEKERCQRSAAATFQLLELASTSTDVNALCALAETDDLPLEVTKALLDNPCADLALAWAVLDHVRDPADLGFGRLERMMNFATTVDDYAALCQVLGVDSFSWVPDGERTSVFNALLKMNPGTKNGKPWQLLARSFTDTQLDSINWVHIERLAGMPEVTDWLDRRLSLVVTDRVSAAMLNRLSSVYTGPSGELFTAVNTLLNR